MARTRGVTVINPKRTRKRNPYALPALVTMGNRGRRKKRTHHKKRRHHTRRNPPRQPFVTQTVKAGGVGALGVFVTRGATARINQAMGWEDSGLKALGVGIGVALGSGLVVDAIARLKPFRFLRGLGTPFGVGGATGSFAKSISEVAQAQGYGFVPALSDYYNRGIYAGAPRMVQAVPAANAQAPAANLMTAPAQAAASGAPCTDWQGPTWSEACAAQAYKAAGHPDAWIAAVVSQGSWLRASRVTNADAATVAQLLTRTRNLQAAARAAGVLKDYYIRRRAA